MKFAMMFANAGPLGYPQTLEPLARTAEAVGLESIWTIEHVVIPVGYKSKYPYDPSGKIPGPEDMPMSDPVLPLAFAAAVTKRLRLGTGILILPQRHPLYVAKEMATLDVLSGGRAILGIGVGWLEEEFQALGIPFETRGSRTAESVRAIRSLWKDEPEPFEGKFFKWKPLESNPKPVQKPGVPIVVGGHTPLSAKRAARYADGFFPGVSDPGKLESLIGVLRDECRRIGRKPEEIELTAGLGVTNADAVKRVQDLGVARVGIAPPAFDPEGIQKGLETFAAEVMAKV